MSELKPCAHCGGEAKLIKNPHVGWAEIDNDGNETSGDLGKVFCPICRIGTEEMRVDVAIAAWNRRTAEPNEPLPCESCMHHDPDSDWPDICAECKRMSRPDMYRRKSEKVRKSIDQRRT